MDLGDGKDVFDALPTRVRSFAARVLVVVLALLMLLAPTVGRRASAAVVRVLARATCQQLMESYASLLDHVQIDARRTVERSDPCRY